VRTARPDGTEGFDQVPLTLVDVLHPEPGDTIPEGNAHDDDLSYLKSLFTVQLRDDPTAVVLSRCLVDFNIPGVKRLAPDIAVFLGVRRHIGWSSFDVAEEGARTALVVEVTSPETRSNDIEIKLDYYHRANVPWYVIADVSRGEDDERQIELFLYRWAPGGYERVEPDESGRVWLEPVRLWLGQMRDRRDGYMVLACFDPGTGKAIGDYTAISSALAESRKRRAEDSRPGARPE
jgi:Uma2 family endonuclease